MRLRSGAPRQACAPSSTAPTFVNAPPKAPNGVRAPSMMTMSCSAGRSCIAAPSSFGTGAGNVRDRARSRRAPTASMVICRGLSPIEHPAKRVRPILVVHDEGIEWILLEPSAPSEKRQLDQEGGPDEHPAQSLDELERGRHGTAGGQQVVDREDALSRSDRVLVNREDVGSILERVFLLDRLE